MIKSCVNYCTVTFEIETLLMSAFRKHVCVIDLLEIRGPHQEASVPLDTLDTLATRQGDANASLGRRRRVVAPSSAHRRPGRYALLGVFCLWTFFWLDFMCCYLDTALCVATLKPP